MKSAFIIISSLSFSQHSGMDYQGDMGGGGNYGGGGGGFDGGGFKQPGGRHRARKSYDEQTLIPVMVA